MIKTVLHMNINPELKKELAKQAKKDNRSLANLVETALIEFLRAKGVVFDKEGVSREHTDD